MTELPRRSVLKAIGSAGAMLTLGGVGVAGAREGASADQTLVDLAIAVNEPGGAFAGEFDVLIAALVANPDLLATLDGRRGQYTVFAPDDDAFDAAGFDPSNADQIPADVLEYHVTRGRRYSDSVLGAPRLRMLNGGFVTQDGGVLNDGQATITDTDFEASNGVLHVISGVLLED
ncbi:fasciclin domain-containing protein [Salinigranum sp.]|uniref:fasciclin domain-containing protein n=1 Tax=Salinigranum sp. TaxID=1966351 RepID=UPI0035650D9D